METKVCYECGIEKPLSKFYKHPETKDGYAGKCKDCAKQYVIAVYKKRRIDPGRIEVLRRREIEKQNGYQDKSYRDLFPEKVKAHGAVCNLRKVDGMHLHHWSYLKIHWQDVIELSVSDHAKIHVHTKYDQERMQFRTLKGVLLDTKDQYIKYMNYIFRRYNKGLI